MTTGAGTRTLAASIEPSPLIDTPIRMPSSSIWPDCPLCKESVVKCMCPPDQYAAAVYAAIRMEY
jgi:hypothetical protein